MQKGREVERQRGSEAEKQRSREAETPQAMEGAGLDFLKSSHLQCSRSLTKQDHPHYGSRESTATVLRTVSRQLGHPQHGLFLPGWVSSVDERGIINVKGYCSAAPVMLKRGEASPITFDYLQQSVICSDRLVLGALSGISLSFALFLSSFLATRLLRTP